MESVASFLFGHVNPSEEQVDTGLSRQHRAEKKYEVAVGGLPTQ